MAGDEETASTKPTPTLDVYLDSISGVVDQMLTEPDKPEKDAQRVKDIESKLGGMVRDERIKKILIALKKHKQSAPRAEIVVVERDEKPILSLAIGANTQATNDIKVLFRGLRADAPQEFTLFEVDDQSSDERVRRFKSQDVDAHREDTVEKSDYTDLYIGDVLFSDLRLREGGRFLASYLRRENSSISGLDSLTPETIEKTAMRSIQELVRSATTSTPVPAPPAAHPPVGPTGQ